MNRIILIGNGFDLAHGMRTGYKDFINDFWENICIDVEKSINVNERFENNFIIIDNIPNEWIGDYNYNSLIKSIKKRKSTLRYKNEFLKVITNLCYSPNWVDIENEYYKLLKRCYLSPPTSKTLVEEEEEGETDIQKLNREFKDIQSLLEKYLTKIQDNFKSRFLNSNDDYSLKGKIEDVIYSDFKLKDFSEAMINQLAEDEFQNYNKIVKEIEDNDDNINHDDPYAYERGKRLRSLLKGYEKKDIRNKIRQLLIADNSLNYFRYIPKDILFANFNYTTTETYYLNSPNDREYGKYNTDIIHIHGLLNNNTDNKIIFGFGDELDADYKIIENLNDNEYLKNIKSFKYFESESYKKLLEYIERSPYQIFIFGHSCGNSDRTLLNTLFEHKNCHSIKNFYYIKSDNEDSYNGTIMNISRSFTNKADMRDKVVNKKYSETLV
ncbi:hypothetical protein EH151_04155 [Elizabethkingia anophelis]|uniref:AbiH family protein n=1 Tax=Elizabethkingia anophelis TaxID=1117645 RepID=UPI0013681156|nr:AbiH family protein [Elizabethkingia anophelis]MYZ59084.1 hypothetical protein [Elizabethkingia anophelis]